MAATRYALAVGAVAVGFTLISVRGPSSGGAHVVLCPVIIGVALFGGLGPGLVATAIVTALVATTGLLEHEARESWGAWLLMGTLVSALAALFRRTQALRHPDAAALPEREVVSLEQREKEGFRYHFLLNNSRDFIFIVRCKDGLILEANDAACTAYGYNYQELTAMTVHQLRSPAERPTTAQHMARAEREGFRFETVHQRRDGSTFPVEVNSQGAILGGERILLSIVRDISERRAAELQLANALHRLERAAAETEQNRAQLEAVLQAVKDGIMVADGEGKWLLLNQAQVDINGFEHADDMKQCLAVFERLYELRLPDGTTLPVADWPISRVLRGESVVNWELLGRRRDIGREWFFSFSGEPVLDEQGKTKLAIVITRDITRAKQAENELAAREAQLRLFVEHTPAAVAMLDRNMTYLVVSRRYATDYRVPHTDLIGRSHYDMFPELPERWKETHRRCLAGAVEKCDEDPFPRPDGTTDWVRWEMHPWRTTTGEIGGVILFSEMITEQKLVIENLAAERERLAVTLRCIADGVIATDEHARIEVFNTVAASLTGWSIEEAMGRPLHEVFRAIDETTGQPVASPVDRILRGESAAGFGLYTLLVARDGTRRPIADSAAPIRNANGSVSGVVLVFRDQTEDRRTQQALSKSEERFRALIEKASDILVVLDAQMRVTFWSPSATRQLGWQADEVIGREVLELVHRDDWQKSKDSFVPLFASPGATVRLVVRHLHRDGSIRLVEVVGRNLLAEPAVQGIVANLRDITEQRRLAEQVEQAQKLESIGRLAGGIAHDFNNLLTVILACSDALRSSLDESQDESREDAEHIFAAAQRARDLTRQLLAFARKQVIAPVALDLGAVVRGSEKLLRRVLGEDVRLVVNLSPDLWLVHCDPGQIEQVILNLALNARDAMPKGGTVVIGTENVVIETGQEGPPGESVCLTVRDTGTGMSDEVKAHLFEPFFTTKPTGRGTGLGLATVYGIVRQSGGTVHVESELGRGTTVRIHFPRTFAAPAALPPPAPTVLAGTESVLVVEDDELVRDIAVRALRSGGYDVHVVSRPEDALNLPLDQLERLRLLITDVVMPGLDGRALAEELLRRHPALRVLYVSGYTQDVIAERGILDPHTAFLAKPFTAPALLARVRSVLDAAAEP